MHCHAIPPHNGLGVAKVEILAKWFYASKCQGVMSGPHVTTTFHRTAEKRNKMVRSPIVPTEKSAKLTQCRFIAPLDEKLTAYLAKKLAFATPRP
jgi:hypothetical protein